MNNEENKADNLDKNQELTKSDTIWGCGCLTVLIILVVLFCRNCVYIEPVKTPETQTTQQKTEVNDKSYITKEKYGEDYPFTIDNLTLKCEDDAVWVEDSALNKYALNGLADSKFRGRGDYKGYTTSIEKPDPDIPGTTLGDGGMLVKGMEFCK